MPRRRSLSETGLLSAALLFLTSMLSLAVLAMAVRTPAFRSPRLALELVACLPVLFARRWPIGVMAVGATGAALEMSTASRFVAFSAVLGVATYYLATQRPRKVSVPVAVTAAVGLGSALVSALVRTPVIPLGPDAVESFLPLVAAWFIGDSVAARRRYLAGLAAQAERERQAEIERARQQVREERVRIARELHDVVAHTLAVITVQSGVGRRLMGRQPDKAAAALESIETIGRTAQDELRVVLALLRDEEKTAPALAPAPRLVDLKDVIDNIRPSGTAVELRVSGDDLALSPALELTVYRVVQEALTNVVRHAPGANAVVEVSVGSREVVVEVTDDGVAPGSPAHGFGTGHGILGMRERVTAFGGTLTASPREGGGFRVSGRIPLEGTG